MTTEEKKPEVKLVRDKIWRTAKSRMRAEVRYRRYHLAAHFFISYYSLLVIIASIFASELTELASVTDKIVIALSVVVFSLSLVIYGFRFSETADKHRECYLRLQRILDDSTIADLADQYHSILQHYPNHHSHDYDDLLVQQAILLGRPLTEVSTGDSVKPSLIAVVSYFARRILWWVFCATFALMPLLVWLPLFCWPR